MTRSFFQSLEEHRVSFLLISGQATVLYGAAAFSEDIDLWVEPNEENIQNLRRALRAVAARYYKLTPELTADLMEKGHGFHFLLGDNPPVYLDVLGRPPRVGSFSSAKDNSTLFDTEWGTIPVIGLKDLVEVKKTQRMEDYSIISRLATEWLDRPECKRTHQDFGWAIDNVFTLQQLEILARHYPKQVGVSIDEPISSYISAINEEREVPNDLQADIVRLMQERMQSLQHSDRIYWREIIADLRRLKAKNALVAAGSPV